MKPSVAAGLSADTGSLSERGDPTRLLLEAVVLAALPLASNASLWGGAPGATWPELWAVPVWIVAALAGRRAWLHAGRGAWPTLVLYLAAVAAGTVIVLSEQHRIGSPLLVANLGVAARSWFGAWSTADPLYPLRSAAVYVAGPLFFVAVRTVWNSERRPMLLESMILWGGAAAAATAIVQVGLGRGLTLEIAPGEPAVARAAGPLPDPNAFASYLALVAAFGAVVWTARAARAGDGRPARRVLAPVAWGALISAGLWVSGSRAAILALLALLAVSVAIRLSSSRARGDWPVLLTVAGAAVLALAGVVVFASLGGYGTVPAQSLSHRFLSTFDIGQSSMRLFRGRPVLWQAGATMVADEPIVGVGAGRYGVELGGRVPVELWGVTTAENAHNYYLQSAAETGLIGLLALLLLLAIVAGALVNNRDDVRARAALFGAAAWSLTCLVGHPQLIPSLQLFFWGFLGMATAGRRLPRLGLGPAGLCVLLALPAVRVGQELLAAKSGPALYSVGLHAREPSDPGNEILRWTSSNTRLDLRRDGRVVEIRFLVAHDEFPVTVRSVVGPWVEEYQFFDGGWKTLAYYLPPERSRRAYVSLDASPPFRATEDSRDLGVMLAPLRWRSDAPSEPLGTYPPEQGADGRWFQWTSGVACLPLGGSDDVEVGLRADNPDLEADPLTVTLVREGVPEQAVAIGDRSWRSIRVPGGESAADLLCVQTSRTWNPRAESGSADARNLGVAVSIAGGEIARGSDRR